MRQLTFEQLDKLSSVLVIPHLIMLRLLQVLMVFSAGWVSQVQIPHISVETGMPSGNGLSKTGRVTRLIYSFECIGT